jgi:alanyl-tRNA synthetase
VLGIKENFLSKVVDVAIRLASGCDEEVPKNGARIKQEVAREEER